jgi:hypothetical protein
MPRPAPVINQTVLAFMLLVLPLRGPALTDVRTCDEIQSRAFRGR